MINMAVFPCADLDGIPSSSSKESESDLGVFSRHTDSAKLNAVLPVSSTSLEDDFLEGFLAV